VELLQAAMVEVEADVLASAEDKAAQRAAHEARITALQDQLAGLRKQLKDQVCGCAWVGGRGQGQASCCCWTSIV
jgi:hypothetical protein